MSIKMKEMPETERPYEKLKMYGAEKLSNTELLAIIIKCGTRNESSIDVANRILLSTQNLKDIRETSIKDLTKIKGIGEVKAIQLKAVCELTSRMSKNNRKINVKIEKPRDVAELLMKELQFEKQERMKALILNSKNQLIKIKDIVLGDTRTAYVTVKQIIAENVRMQEPKLIIVHNHPSGDPTPSSADIAITKKVIEAGEILGIQMLDHIVIGNNRYVSIVSKMRAEKGLT